MKVKLPHYAVREVRVAICSAKLAMHLFRCAIDRGDMTSARQYRIEAREYLAKARFRVLCALSTDDVDYLALRSSRFVFPKLPANKVPEVVQDEPTSESVSASTAPGRLRLCGVLVQPGASKKIGKPERVHIQLVSFDGISPRRDVFPRLGKHWAPASILVGHQERKGHAFLRS